MLDRLIALLEQAAQLGVKLVVFRKSTFIIVLIEADHVAETTFTTFFPRYYIPDEAELAGYFEREDPVKGITVSENVEPFFKRARELGLDVQIGYGEDTGTERFNTAVYVGGKGDVLGKYRKVSRSQYPSCSMLKLRSIYLARSSRLTMTRPPPTSSRSVTSCPAI